MIQRKASAQDVINALDLEPHPKAATFAEPIRRTIATGSKPLQDRVT